MIHSQRFVIERAGVVVVFDKPVTASSFNGTRRDGALKSKHGA